jgi:integrase
MNKRDLSERDICSQFIGPAIEQGGWDRTTQVREEVSFTKGRIIVRGKLVSRGKAKRADYILYYKPNIPIAIVEAKDNCHSVGDGMQQALEYAKTLNIPFVFTSNGDGFVFHDRTGTSAQMETNLSLSEFPSPEVLWEKYRAWKGLTPEAEKIVLQDYYDDASGKAPRYYQANAVNATVEAIAKGQDRVLLVMATGTGKTYTAFKTIFLSREEFDQLRNVIETRFPEHLAEYVVAVHTGMRLSEQYTIEVGQFDRHRHAIHLDRTKNGDARTVHLNSQALAAIESVLHPRQKRSERIFTREDRSKVYTDRKQERFDNRSWFEVAVKEAQIPRITWHGLRHTFCSWIAMAGATTREIMEAAGHKTMSQAARYAHLSPQHTQSVVDRIVGTR